MNLIFPVAVWFLIMASLGAVGAPYGKILLPYAKDGATGLGRVLALGLWMLVFWLGASLGIARPSLGWAILSIIPLVIGALAIRRKEVPLKNNANVLWEAALFLGACALFLLARSFFADIWGTDQPEDFMIFESCLHARSYPPPDLWFSGHSLNYYYLSHLVFVPPALITGLPTEFTTSLAMATVLPLAMGVLSSFFSTRIPSFRVACALASMSILGGNLGTFYRWATIGDSVSWKFMANLFRGEISEFPMFTFFVGSLHAQFNSWPWTLAAAVSVMAWTYRFEERPVFLGALAGWLCAIHDGMNSWALPMLGLLVIISWLVRLVLGHDHSKDRSKLWMTWASFFIVALIVDIFFAWHASKPPILVRWVGRSDRTDVGIFFAHWGPLIGAYFLWAFRNISVWPMRTRTLIAVVTLLSVILLGPVVGVLVFLAICVRFELRGMDRSEQSVWSLVLTVLLALIAVEFVYLEDPVLQLVVPRTNTVGKTAYIGWGWLLLALPIVLRGLGTGRQILLGLVALLTLVFIPTVFMTGSRSIQQTLDGLSWLKITQPDDAMAIGWLRTNSKPGDRVIEAVAAGTPNFSILSTFSGRPTPVAMTDLIGQARSHQLPEISQRTDDIREIYETLDSGRRRQLLSKYEAKFVVMSSRERASYRTVPEQFTEYPVAFSSGDVTLYSVDAKPAPSK